MATLKLDCDLCNEEVVGSVANEHLRSHHAESYNVFSMKSSKFNVTELGMYQMVGNFDKIYAEIKHLLKAKNMSLHLLPTLDVDESIYVIQSGMYL